MKSVSKIHKRFRTHCFLAASLFLCVCTSLARTQSVSTYDELLSAIRKARSETRDRIEEAVRQEKVREAWEIGKLIDEHVLRHQERAEYGEEVVKRLAGDLGMSETELRYMLQFARTYPIHRPADELSWSAYESLLAINDDATRDSLIKKAAKENWTRDQVREAVKAYKAKLDAEAAGTQGLSPKGTVPFVEPVPGTPYTYFVTRDTRGNLVLDLGFSNYYRPPGEFDFNESDIVMVQGSERFSTLGFELETLDSGLGTLDSELYTYHAYIINVIDGDTFNAVIDLGFGISTVQTLRLRGLDAPEIESAEGRESKVFLESLLGASQDSRGVMHYAQSPVVIKTSHSDKYDRYLVDVWIKTVHTSSNVGAQHAAPLVYVNQKLIEEGHATIVE